MRKLLGIILGMILLGSFNVQEVKAVNWCDGCSGSIYYTGGNVGIGVAPAAKLHIDFGYQPYGSYGDAATAIKISGSNDSSSVYGGIVWKDSDSGAPESFGIYLISARTETTNYWKNKVNSAKNKSKFS